MSQQDEASRQARRAVDEILSDPELKKRLVEALKSDLESQERAHLWNDRLKPFFAGLTSAAVIVLAFLIPSLQDLWDRWETRSAIHRYAEIGRHLIDEGEYTAAEEAFDRALELAGNQREDLFEEKMKARIARVEENAAWRGEVPEDLTESDFLYVLELQKGPGHARDRAVTLTSYGAFLAGKKRWQDAEHSLREALELDPASANAHVNLGNLLSDLSKGAAAEAEYRHAVELDPEDPNARYDLAVQLSETGRPAEAAEQFRIYTSLKPEDAIGFVRLAQQLHAEGKLAEARTAYERARALDPSNADLAKGLSALRADGG